MVTLFNGIPLGIQSWGFRNFTNEQIIPMLKSCNVNMLEICTRHLDVHLGMEQAEEIVGLYKSHGISFNSFGINDYKNDETRTRALFEFARKAGIKTVGANPEAQAFPLLEKLCEEYQIKLAIHNHGRQDKIYGKLEQLEEAMARTSDNIGICLDTGWVLDIGEDPVEAIERFSSRIYGVHFKDFVLSEDGVREEKVIGEGKLDLNAAVKALKKMDFKGYLTIEYSADADNPVPNMKKCIDRLVQADRQTVL